MNSNNYEEKSTVKNIKRILCVPIWTQQNFTVDIIIHVSIYYFIYVTQARLMPDYTYISEALGRFSR